MEWWQSLKIIFGTMSNKKVDIISSSLTELEDWQVREYLLKRYFLCNSCTVGTMSSSHYSSNHWRSND